jgi:hypothetical protein
MRSKLLTAVRARRRRVGGGPVVLLARRLHRRGFDPRNDAAPEPLDLQVTAVSAETVTLRRAAKAPATLPDAVGEYLLQGARGFGYAGPVIESNGIIAIREFRPGKGELRAGDYARLDGYAFPIDPWQAHGIAFETGRVQLASRGISGVAHRGPPDDVGDHDSRQRGRPPRSLATHPDTDRTGLQLPGHHVPQRRRRTALAERDVHIREG